jgi:hypothetical protein
MTVSVAPPIPFLLGGGRICHNILFFNVTFNSYHNVLITENFKIYKRTVLRLETKDVVRLASLLIFIREILRSVLDPDTHTINLTEFFRDIFCSPQANPVILLNWNRLRLIQLILFSVNLKFDITENQMTE